MINDNHCTRGTEGQQISLEQTQRFPAHSPLSKGESTSRAGPIFKTPFSHWFSRSIRVWFHSIASGWFADPNFRRAKLSCLSVILFCPIVHVFPNRLQRREDLDAFCFIFCYPLSLLLPFAFLSCPFLRSIWKHRTS